MMIKKLPKNVAASQKLRKRPVRRPIKAEDELLEENVEVSEVEVDPAATDLLFEAEDVAELVAEITGEEVTVEVDDEADAVTFEVGEEVYTVEPEGDEEILEASRKVLKGKKAVRASRSLRRRRR